MSDQYIYEIQITRCYVPSSTNYSTLLSAISPTLEGVIDIANHFYSQQEKDEEAK